jgi:molybdopterin-guanine dinucleotide biosynthesis protein A
MKYDMVAVIFAGGKSSRMGTDKALLPFGSYGSLSEFQYHKLKRLFKNVYISSKEDKFDFDIETIYDCYQESSPLVGVISIFERLDVDEVFILSVDAPFVEKTTIETLLKHRESGYDAIIAQSPNGIEPLCGIYRSSILPLAKKRLREKRYRLYELLKDINSLYVKFDKIQPFTNLNYPNEYKEALKEIP